MHFQVNSYGSVDSLPYAATGSGSVVAMSVIESGYRDNMPRDAAMDLVARSIMSGVYNDLGSGSNVDLLTIGPGGEAVFFRNYKLLYEKLFTPKFPLE